MPETHHPISGPEKRKSRRKVDRQVPVQTETPASPLPAASPDANETRPISRRNWKNRLRVGIGITLSGLFLYTLGVAPNLFNLDRSPVTGFIQIAVFLIGLAFICLGGYISLNALWNGQEKSILADIGLRLVSTGYVISVGSAMADIFGFGTHTLPKIPYFGPYQAIGFIMGEIVIAIGFLLLIPFPPKSAGRRRAAAPPQSPRTTRKDK